jgi:hypothetical protein
MRIQLFVILLTVLSLSSAGQGLEVDKNGSKFKTKPGARLDTVFTSEGRIYSVFFSGMSHYVEVFDESLELTKRWKIKFPENLEKHRTKQIQVVNNQLYVFSRRKNKKTNTIFAHLVDLNTERITNSVELFEIPKKNKFFVANIEQKGVTIYSQFKDDKCKATALSLNLSLIDSTSINGNKDDELLSLKYCAEGNLMAVVITGNHTQRVLTKIKGEPSKISSEIFPITSSLSTVILSPTKFGLVAIKSAYKSERREHSLVQVTALIYSLTTNKLDQIKMFEIVGNDVTTVKTLNLNDVIKSHPNYDKVYASEFRVISPCEENSNIIPGKLRNIYVYQGAIKYLVFENSDEDCTISEFQLANISKIKKSIYVLELDKEYNEKVGIFFKDQVTWYKELIGYNSHFNTKGQLYLTYSNMYLVHQEISAKNDLSNIHVTSMEVNLNDQKLFYGLSKVPNSSPVEFDANGDLTELALAIGDESYFRLYPSLSFSVGDRIVYYSPHTNINQFRLQTLKEPSK